MILSIVMTMEIQEFMELYDRSAHHLHGEFKLSHLEVGKLLRCWTTTDKYGNIYHRNLTSNMREHLVLGRDYVIVPKMKHKQGQRIWYMTKTALYAMAMHLRWDKQCKCALRCNERLQTDFSTRLLGGPMSLDRTSNGCCRRR